MVTTPPPPSGGGKPRRVAIVGAGIGGLATALALLRTPGTGIEALTLLDARPSLDTALGGALNLTAGAAVLAALGLDVRPAGNPVARVVSRIADGSPGGGGVLLDVDVAATVRRMPAAAATLIDPDEGGLYAVTVMRDTLQRLLAEAVEADERVRLVRGVKVEGVAAVGGGALEGGGTYRLLSEGGEPADGSAEYDLVVGADGVNSAVRRAVMEATGGDGGGGGRDGGSGGRTAIYSGIRCQFGVAPPAPPGSTDAADSGGGGVLRQWFGDGGYALQYGAGGGTRLLVFSFASPGVTGPGGENAAYATATGDGVGADLRARLAAAGMPATTLRLADECTRFIDTATYYHPVLRRWSAGGVTVVGDAAHALPPFLGAGANQAIVDAAAVAAAVAAIGGVHGDLGAALAAVEARRKPPTAAVMRASRAVGWLETLRGGVGCAFRNGVFRVAGLTGAGGRAFVASAVPNVMPGELSGGRN